MEHFIRQRFQPNRPLRQGEYVTGSKEHIALSRRAAAESIVLLKNENGVLPLAKGKRVALFGKGTIDYVKGGGGSGDVACAYIRNLYDGFVEGGRCPVYEPLVNFYKKYVSEQLAEGAAPGMFREPKVPAELMDGASAFTDTAILSICRFSGEGWDRAGTEVSEEFNPWASETDSPKTQEDLFPDSDFYLSAEEKKLLEQVKEHFRHVIVVMNVGGVVDLTFIRDDDQIEGAVQAFQGGMEGASAVADVLTGKVCPSGHLTDTYAAKIDDYPSTAGFHESTDYVEYTEDIYVGYRYFETIPGAQKKVVYPFGYGLSYTEFAEEVVSAEFEGGVLNARIRVTNLGPCSGKWVTGIYGSAPQGKLGHAKRELLAFAKTRELLSGESQELLFHVSDSDLAAFDEEGVFEKSAFVLEPGTYSFYYGINVETAKHLIDVEIEGEPQVVRQLHSYMAPTTLHKKMLADGSYREPETTEPYDINSSVIEKFKGGREEALSPVERTREPYYLMREVKKGAISLADVVEGRNTAAELVQQMTDDELIHLLGGQPNRGVANTYGIGNLSEYGIPSFQTADGPAGVRIHEFIGIPTTAWPCATALASTFNTELVREVGAAGGEELKENNLSMWLTPAVNIHRNPMCGRNFEYYSEDPLVAGKMGAAMVRGIQSNRVSACVKHFACNNKETNRKHSDSRVSERAMREIYLKAFEIIVREADPWSIMTSYNAINGRRASEAKELIQGILRGEWGYKGLVISDWWNRAEQYKEILAGNDVKMPTGFPDRVKAAMEKGALSREDLLEPAEHVIEFMAHFE